MTEIALGKPTTYPDHYAPDCLYRIGRDENRAQLRSGKPLPFSGVDIWNAWDLSWLAESGRPQVATAEIRIPADSPGLVESKSMKLYLGSFAMSRHESAAELRDLIARDVGACTGAPVHVRIEPVATTEGRCSQRLPGESIDGEPVPCDSWEVNPELLRADASTVVSEDLYTHLLRSLCPVTSQPDAGSVLVSYRGPRLDRGGLLRYIVSFRQHKDFHENCVERMFVDILERCEPEKLTVYARYQRRGGLDINPFRSNFESAPRNLRLWRQ